MTTNKGSSNAEEKNLEVQISEWRKLIGITAGGLIVILVAYFWLWDHWLKSCSSSMICAKSIGDFGAFGDFIGGLMNPLVAFAAFYWLTQSVKLQKKEMIGMREATRDSASALAEQANLTQKNLKIAAATALLNVVQSQIESKKKEIEELDAKYDGKQPPPHLVDENLDLVAKQRNELTELIQKRELLSNQLSEVLNLEITGGLRDADTRMQQASKISGKTQS